MCVRVVAEFIAYGYAEHNVALPKRKLSVCELCSALIVEAEGSAVACKKYVCCGGKINLYDIILNVKSLDHRWIISTACAVEISVFKSIEHLSVFKLLSTDNCRASEAISVRFAGIVVIIAHCAEEIIHTVSYHIVVDIGTILTSCFKLC